MGKVSYLTVGIYECFIRNTVSVVKKRFNVKVTEKATLVISFSIVLTTGVILAYSEMYAGDAKRKL